MKIQQIIEKIFDLNGASQGRPIWLVLQTSNGGNLFVKNDDSKPDYNAISQVRIDDNDANIPKLMESLDTDASEYKYVDDIGKFQAIIGELTFNLMSESEKLKYNLAYLQALEQESTKAGFNQAAFDSDFVTTMRTHQRNTLLLENAQVAVDSTKEENKLLVKRLEKIAGSWVTQSDEMRVGALLALRKLKKGEDIDEATKARFPEQTAETEYAGAYAAFKAAIPDTTGVLFFRTEFRAAMGAFERHILVSNHRVSPRFGAKLSMDDCVKGLLVATKIAGGTDYSAIPEGDLPKDESLRKELQYIEYYKKLSELKETLKTKGSTIPQTAIYELQRRIEVGYRVSFRGDSLTLEQRLQGLDIAKKYTETGDKQETVEPFIKEMEEINLMIARNEAYIKVRPYRLQLAVPRPVNVPKEAESVYKEKLNEWQLKRNVARYIIDVSNKVNYEASEGVFYEHTALQRTAGFEAIAALATAAQNLSGTKPADVSKIIDTNDSNLLPFKEDLEWAQFGLARQQLQQALIDKHGDLSPEQYQLLLDVESYTRGKSSGFFQKPFADRIAVIQAATAYANDSGNTDLHKDLVTNLEKIAPEHTGWSAIERFTSTGGASLKERLQEAKNHSPMTVAAVRTKSSSESPDMTAVDDTPHEIKSAGNKWL